MIFASIYTHYLSKIQKKGRTKQELHQVITCLTGLDEQALENSINEKVDLEYFFKQAKIHPNATKIKGLICGYRIEEIDVPLIRKIRYLDKLVDELARGRKVEKILRK